MICFKEIISYASTVKMCTVSYSVYVLADHFELELDDGMSCNYINSILLPQNKIIFTCIISQIISQIKQKSCLIHVVHQPFNLTTTLQYTSSMLNYLAKIIT